MAHEERHAAIKVDTPLNLSDVEGASLARLTRPTTVSYKTYIEHIAQIANNGYREGIIAREVKLADLKDNLNRIPTAEKYNQQMHNKMAHIVSNWPSWEDQWGSLKKRYEKAITILEQN